MRADERQHYPILHSLDIDDKVLLIVRSPRGESNSSEIWEFGKHSLAEEKTCNAIKTSQILETELTGSILVLSNKTLLIRCSISCQVFTNDSWTAFDSHDLVSRTKAMTSVLSDVTAIIAGGVSSNGSYMTVTELVSVIGDNRLQVDFGPDLPTAQQMICLSKLNSTLVIAVLKDLANSHIVFGYDISRAAWIMLPFESDSKSFQNKTTILDCAVIKDEQDRAYVVFLGLANNGADAGTDLWDIARDAWFSGPDIPGAYFDHHGVITRLKPDQSGLLLLPLQTPSHILELRCHGQRKCLWIEHEARLETTPTDHMFLPGHFLGCTGRLTFSC